MCAVSVENALKLAILKRPASFGLEPEDVNPLLRFILKLIEGEDEDSSKLAVQCFEECNGVVYQKVAEVLQADALRTAKLKSVSGSKASGAKSIASKSTKPAGNGDPAAASNKLSVKQLRYLGYLHRQLGEEPDYKAIAELTQKQATMRIRDLEKQLGVGSEA